jgi:hypothetical protein
LQLGRIESVNANSRIILNITKTVAIFLLFALLLGSNGCVTYCTVQKAEGHPERANWSQFVGRQTPPPPCQQPPKPKPAYYALLPLTIPADIALYPIQAFGWFVDQP